MSALATVAAIAVSAGAIGRLAATDPKRRRSFGLPPHQGRRRAVLAVAAVFLPGALLLVFGTGADFVAWLGAVCVAGWAVAAVPPARAARLAGRIAATASRAQRIIASAAAYGVWLAGATVAPLRRQDDAGWSRRFVRPGSENDDALHRIAELEYRVAQLEVALAAAAGLSRLSDEPRIARLADFQEAKVLRTGDR